MDLFINKKVWNQFSDAEMEQYQEELFQYYRARGFPYFPTDLEYRKKKFKQLKSYDYKRVMDGDIIRQTMHGLGLAWSFMPHACEIKCGKMRTPFEVFYSDVDLKKVISHRFPLSRIHEVIESPEHNKVIINR